MSGPELGYVATPVIVVQAALALLEGRDRIVAQRGPGGVFTPGATSVAIFLEERERHACSGSDVVN